MQLQWYLTTMCKCCKWYLSLYVIDCTHVSHLLCRITTKVRSSNDQVELLILEYVMQGTVDAGGRCSTELNHAAAYIIMSDAYHHNIQS